MPPPTPATGPTLDGVQMPPLVYGTAWKEEETARFTRMALEAGFRGIDTANQRKHYHEAAVGQGLQAAIQAGTLTREDVFLQTKFTFRAGQDHRLPYDEDAPISHQVRQSVASSLDHLGVDRFDALLLHGPSFPVGWHDPDAEAWTAIEDLHREGRVRLLGLSNGNLDQLETLHRTARVPPRIVQNRTLWRPQSDRAVRDYCRAHGIAYQAFSLLTARPNLLSDPDIEAVAEAHDATPAQIIFAYAIREGLVPLTGTRSRTHMDQDLHAATMALTQAEHAILRRRIG